MKGAGIRLILSYKFATAVQHFLLLLQKKTQRIRNDHGGTSRRERRLLSSVLISSFPNRKRCAGLRFGVRRIANFPPDPLEAPKKTPLVFLDLSRENWQICAKNYIFLHPLPLPLGEVAERSEVGEGIRRTQQPQDPLSRLRRQLSRRESQACGLVILQ